VFKVLEGKTVNLRIMEKDDLPLFAEWVNNPEFMGEFVPLRQETRTDLGRTYDSPKDARVWFVAEKKDGTKIGYIAHFLSAGEVELGYFIVPNERRKGYVSEAITIMIDYLFLSKDIVRIQARADPENLASCKALEKAEFTREGILRKTCYCMGQWRDDCMYSILREEWKEPKILAKTT
jgi:ribosomal-protein-alanine N-acetyltransferase